MDYIVNTNDINFKIIMFEYGYRNWEICLEAYVDEDYIQYSISKRCSELLLDFENNGSYDFSDLIVDYIDYEKINKD